MTAPTATAEIIPGLYDIPAEVYHSDPVPGGSLSSTGARQLADCPARFKWALDNPQPPKKAFDVGTAAHKLVLGDGPELVVVDAEKWNTTAIKAEVSAIRAAGAVPLKQAELDQVKAMAAALRQHQEAADLLEPGSGVAEQSMFWEADGIWRRARPDWLRDNEIVDYKTTTSVDPEEISKTVHKWGYHQQADWYRAGAWELELVGPEARFVFIFQEKQPPYLVTVAELDVTAMDIGRRLNEKALYHYAHGMATGNWPGYFPTTALIPLPAWVERQYS
ncbi:hypothetical protein CG740_23350 [Streptomyces sp. CB01201]|uniref:PD-(D/E)XK nuclease-like domain-containing protein n=1 Tax=Streptomyces sp. CB01201 TaxID=2020324 RepID=UPI000C27FA2D|nr:PD-(D/E)XK nuclease-like domain-containing protein [Streptomyces sp. CB01201]PJN00842.1 hypothetical protein CG740_23350 [Streptomyces sp. CB01201]